MADAFTTEGLTDREAAIDAVLRFTVGLDDADQDLVRSAFTEDGVADLRPASVIGVDLPMLERSASGSKPCRSPASSA